MPNPEFLNFFEYIVTPFDIPNTTSKQITSVTTGLFWWYGIEMDGHIPSQLNYLTLNDIENETFEEKKENISTIMSAKKFSARTQKKVVIYLQTFRG